jgi:DNA-binding MarR family transcriptional regulator
MGGETSEAGLGGARLVPTTCLGLHVRRAARILTQIYDAALQPAGLAMNQFSLLVAIHLLDGAPISRLALRLDCDQTTLSRNLRPLLREGWITIQPGQDRRIRQVSLTPAGRAVLQEALPLWERVQEEVKRHYGEASWDSLLSLLEKTRTLREEEVGQP